MGRSVNIKTFNPDQIRPTCFYNFSTKQVQTDNNIYNLLNESSAIFRGRREHGQQFILTATDLPRRKLRVDRPYLEIRHAGMTEIRTRLTP